MLKLRNGNIRLKGGKKAKTGIIKTAALIKKKKPNRRKLGDKTWERWMSSRVAFFFFNSFLQDALQTNNKCIFVSVVFNLMCSCACIIYQKRKIAISKRWNLENAHTRDLDRVPKILLVRKRWLKMIGVLKKTKKQKKQRLNGPKWKITTNFKLLSHDYRV